MDTYDKYAMLRDKKGYTDYRVCKLAGIETSTMSSWKTKRYEPKVPTLQKIAVVLECNLSDFYEKMGESHEDVIISITWLEELGSRLNNIVSLLGAVDIGVMKEIVGISEMIEEAQARSENVETTTELNVD